VSRNVGKINGLSERVNSLIGRLPSTTIAVLPAPLQHRSLHRQQIQELKLRKGLRIINDSGHQSQIGTFVVDWESKSEQRKIGNSASLLNDNFFGRINYQGWGAFCKGNRTGGPWNG